jgi:hypothetical protein
MTTPDYEMWFGPNDLDPNLVTSRDEMRRNFVRSFAVMPDVTNITREQRVSDGPIGGIVIPDSTSREREVIKLIPPSRIVIHTIRRVRDHEVRLDATEHALDVRRHRAVAAEEAMPAEQP